MSAEAFSLYGTAEPAGRAQPLAAGRLAMEIEAGQVRGITWRGRELVRAISYPVRDKDWGTMPLRTTGEEYQASSGALRYRRKFETEGGAFTGEFRLDGTAGDNSATLVAMVSFSARRAVTVNRIGFTILHPIAGIAGSALQIRHSGGQEAEVRFPERIAPAQPARDIHAMRYGADGACVAIEMEGEVFEMEDQRNWSDASFKTYCRPLALPHPFALSGGDAVTQTLRLGFSGPGPAARTGPGRSGALDLGAETGELPDLMLAVEPGWSGSIPEDAKAPMRRLVRLDLAAGHGMEELAACLAAGGFDLELVTVDDRADAERQLHELAIRLSATGKRPGHVLALPAAYLKSYQPDGVWPSGATPAEVQAFARAAFPGARIGGGSLTNFTEFNRHPPDPAASDYVSHGGTAIVHAADDRSVIETLEAMPQIFASTAAIGKGKPCRLGLLSIGMRSNPYGASVAANPDRVRRAMAMDDPRQDGLFAAAWLVGLVAATEGSAVAAMALAAPSGPFGLVGREGRSLRPAYHAIRGLHAMKDGTRLQVRPIDPAIRAVAVRRGRGITLILANLSAARVAVTLPCEMRLRILDAATMAEAAGDPGWTGRTAPATGRQITLPAFATAFAQSPDDSA